MYENVINNSQSVRIYDRKSIEITGIKRIISFNKEEFLLSSNMGNVELKGSNLELIQLNTESGNVKIKGTINSLVYYEEKKARSESVLAKLFK